MPRTRIAWVALPLAFALGWLGEASAQTFKYVDESGGVHFTDSINSVPQRYRSQVAHRAAGEDTFSLGTGADSSAELDWLGSMTVEGVAALARADGESMTPAEQRALRGWVLDWVWVGFWASVVSTLVVLGMVVHAFVAGRTAWGVANLLLGVTALPYILMHVEKPLAVRVGLLAAACAPIPVFALLFTRLVATL